MSRTLIHPQNLIVVDTFDTSQKKLDENIEKRSILWASKNRVQDR